MEKRGLSMGVFVAHEIDWQKNLASGNFFEEFNTGLVNENGACGFSIYEAHVVESLKQACSLLEGLVMVLEPLNFKITQVYFY